MLFIDLNECKSVERKACLPSDLPSCNPSKMRLQMSLKHFLKVGFSLRIVLRQERSSGGKDALFSIETTVEGPPRPVAWGVSRVPR